MPSLPLRFVPPDTPDLASLLIFEAPDILGPFTVIDTVTLIGTYPDYIDHYTTENALSLSDWFAIQWEDSRGGRSELSLPIQGSTQTTIAEIISRVRVRDNSLNERVVMQEAEASIYRYQPTADPYTDLNYSPIELRGLTNLTLAMCYLSEMAKSSGATSSWTAGIVAMKTSDIALKNRVDAIDKLIKRANIDLNLEFSMIALLADVEIAGGAIATVDESRLLVELR